MKRSRYKVLSVGAIRRGTSERTGNGWLAQDVVLEEITDETPYPESFIAQMPAEMVGKIQEGNMVECTPFIKVREYNDRYYNEVRIRNMMPCF